MFGVKKFSGVNAMDNLITVIYGNMSKTFEPGLIKEKKESVLNFRRNHVQYAQYYTTYDDYCAHLKEIIRSCLLYMVKVL